MEVLATTNYFVLTRRYQGKGAGGGDGNGVQVGSIKCHFLVLSHRRATNAEMDVYEGLESGFKGSEMAAIPPSASRSHRYAAAFSFVGSFK